MWGGLRLSYWYSVCAFVLFLTSEAGGQTFQWAKKFGGTTFTNTQPSSMICDNSGNIFITGMFGGTVDFDPSASVFNLTSYGFSYDAFLVKLSPAGNLIFALHFGGSGSVTRGSMVKLDNAGNIYLTGTTTNTADFDPGVGVVSLTSNPFDDIFVCKLNPAGNLIWAKRVGGNGYDLPGGLAFDAAQNPVLTGEFSDIVDFDPGAVTSNLSSSGFADIFIWKLDASGNFQWAKKIGGVNSDAGKSLDCDGSGNIFVTGYYNGTVDFDPGAATFSLSNPAPLSMFILKLDVSGNFVWAKSTGGTGNCTPTYLRLGALGNLYITGSFRDVVDFDPSAATVNITCNGIEDIFILKLNNLGNFSWAKKIGGTGVDRGFMIFLDNAENLYLTGFFQDNIDLDPGAGVVSKTSQGVYDMLTVKLDASGNFQFGYATGGGGYDEGYAAALSPTTCNLIVSGPFQQTVDFDPGVGNFSLSSGSSSAETYIQLMSGIGGVCATSLPVELLTFEGRCSEDKILLQWATASEVNNDFFELERRSDTEEFSVICTKPGRGNSTQVNTYMFDDYDVRKGATYYYRLRQVDYDGSENYSDVIAVKTEISSPLINVSAPNNHAFNIHYELNQSSQVKVEILNSLGQVVSVLQDGVKNPGEHNLLFENARSGIYFIRADIDGVILTRKFNIQ